MAVGIHLRFSRVPCFVQEQKAPSVGEQSPNTQGLLANRLHKTNQF